MKTVLCTLYSEDSIVKIIRCTVQWSQSSDHCTVYSVLWREAVWVCNTGDCTDITRCQHMDSTGDWYMGQDWHTLGFMNYPVVNLLYMWIYSPCFTQWSWWLSDPSNVAWAVVQTDWSIIYLGTLFLLITRPRQSQRLLSNVLFIDWFIMWVILFLHQLVYFPD